MDERVPFQVPRDMARRVTLLGIALYVIECLVYLGLGQMNADEGWYLYASRLVFQGKLPYLDFAYTQMPLLPYVYGVPQIVHPSVLLGRLTSILLSTGTLVMSIVIARRYGGARASAITALLLSAFTFGVYFDSVVKTYALVSFFFIATLFVLSSDLTDGKYPLGLAFALAAALVRITALFFAAPVLLYVLLAASRRRTRALILSECVGAGLLAGFFLLPDWEVARWNLLDSHLSHWGVTPLVTRLRDIVSLRLPDIVHTLGPMLVLCAVALYFILRFRNVRFGSRDCAPLLAATAGLVLFAASHLVNGIWDVEYLVPAFTVFLPIIAVALSYYYGETGSASQPMMLVALIAVLLLLPLGESTQHTDFTGGRLPLEKVDQVASFVAQNSEPGDRVFALQALAVAVDADRALLPGLALAQFSLQDVDTATAQRRHVVNGEMAVKAISQKEARVILLTDSDLGALAGADPAGPANLQQTLAQEYRQVFQMDLFGQNVENIYVYVSR